MITLQRTEIKFGSNTTETFFSYVVKPTIFPDGTSQIWKLPTACLAPGPVKIIWHFENEGEIMHLLQLARLLNRSCDLVIPFLPYGRQDKQVSNDTTFGLSVFNRILHSYTWNSISTFDAHSDVSVNVLRDGGIKSLPVNDMVHLAIIASGADLVCFPDKGASNRGYDLKGVPSFNLDKKRNQLTGEIEGLVCSLPLDLAGKTILLVDDICDGGKTFTESAKLLYGMGAKHVDLYCTHGVFSKGIPTVLATGIRQIYTTDSLVRNQFPYVGEEDTNLTVFKLEM